VLKSVVVRKTTLILLGVIIFESILIISLLGIKILRDQKLLQASKEAFLALETQASVLSPRVPGGFSYKPIGDTLKITGKIIAAKDLFEAKIQADNKVVLGWIPFWDQTAAVASFKKNTSVIDYISLFWYGLRPDGSIRKYIYAVEDTSLIKYAHSKKVKVLALIANLPDEDDRGDWDSERVDLVISSSSARIKHIADLVSLAKKKGFDGINIDYEALKGYQKDDFTAFIKELSIALHKNNKLLAVALHPKVGEGDPEYSNGSQAQDYAQLAKYADQLHLMTYEEHWESSDPGPIASVNWVKSVLSYAKTMIPTDKLFAGVPLYGYDWPEGDSAEGLTYQAIQSLIKTYKPKIVWDATTQANHFTYTVGSNTHRVWYEDNASFTAKLTVFKGLGINSFAFWRLGREDSRVWTTLHNSP